MRRVLWVIAAVAVGLAALPLADATASDPVPVPLVQDVTGWSRASAPLPYDGDGIGPGSYILTTIDSPYDEEDGTFICTGNFIWTDGVATYLGAAGHCFLPRTAGHAIGSNPYVVKVEVCVRLCAFGGQLGAVVNGEFVQLGPVVYARQHKAGDANAQVGWDFGLVTVPQAQHRLLRPRMPVWGGPSGSADRAGDVCMYGSGFVTGETFATKARTGFRPSPNDGDGWSAAMAVNGGDSGSGVNHCTTSVAGVAGTEALGILTHMRAINAVPLPIALGTTVDEARAMVRSDWGRDLQLVNG